MKKKFNLSFSMLFFLIAVMVLSLSCNGGKDSNSGGGGGGGYVNDHGDCAPCSGNRTKSDCKPGFWCSDFVTGPDRCVPDRIRPQDPYTCITTYYIFA
jgi:hypothetical protein